MVSELHGISLISIHILISKISTTPQKPNQNLTCPETKVSKLKKIFKWDQIKGQTGFEVIYKRGQQEFEIELYFLQINWITDVYLWNSWDRNRTRANNKIMVLIKYIYIYRFILDSLKTCIGKRGKR